LHDFTRVDFPIYAKPIVIEDEVWLATDVFVAPGITVGQGSVVGARSTVLTNLPVGMICFGTPAAPRKPRLMVPADDQSLGCSESEIRVVFPSETELSELGKS
jgi:acetyltransferase-like isoleucine patch superfamily enzyme